MKPLLCHRPSSSLFLLGLAAAAAAFIRPVQANAEKVIFTAPAPVSINPLAQPPPTPPSSSSSLSLPPPPPADLLNLITVLGPDASWSIRTNLSRVFPAAVSASASASSEHHDHRHQQGLPAWLLLDNLTEGQRYELRVCWSALEPTSFALDVFSLDTVWQTPDLFLSLAEYASSRQADADHHHDGPAERNPSSVLLLRVLAAADYFSHDASLMKNPPPVLVDLILDPYLYNVVPRSLLPTAGYITVITIVAWFVAQWFAGSLVSIAGSGHHDQMKKQN